MKPNHKLLFSIVAGTSFIFAGCSDNDSDLPIEDITVVEEGSVKPAHKAESTQPTAILGTGGSISGQLSQTFTNIVEPEKAKHVIVACSELDTYEAEIVAAYKRGVVITVVDPIGSKVEGWCAAKGMVYSGDPSANGSSLVSFNRKAVSISIQTTGKQGEEVPIEEDEVPMVIFTGWLDDVLSVNLKGPDYRSRDIRKRFAPQHVSHVFPIDIPADALKESGWGVPENVSLHTTAELSCYVYPMHSFADNASFTGDLYAVEAELTIHNGNLYNGRWEYSQGGKRYESCGFYLSDCGLAVSMNERMAAGLAHSDTHKFAAGPAPVSADASSSCQTGFEWSFDGWLTGGNGLESTTPTPLQEGGWTWNNLGTGDSIGLDIDAMTDGGDVLWTLAVDGLPEEKESTVPAVSSGDLTFRCSWIWGVPQAADDSDGRYYMQVKMNPVYRWTRNAVSGSRMDSKAVSPAVPSACFMLIPPSRTEGQRI